MNDERLRNGLSKAEGRNSGDQGPSGSDMSGCCSPNMTQMMQICPCGSFVKKHWLAAFAVFFLIFLMLVISQLGGILGIIAFFRTL